MNNINEGVTKLEFLQINQDSPNEEEISLLEPWSNIRKKKS